MPVRVATILPASWRKRCSTVWETSGEGPASRAEWVGTPSPACPFCDGEGRVTESALLAFVFNDSAIFYRGEMGTPRTGLRPKTGYGPARRRPYQRGPYQIGLHHP